MEAKALTPRDLFDGKVCYEIPPFQRPYVWTEEDQWQPLWDDIARVAEALLTVGDTQSRPRHSLVTSSARSSSSNCPAVLEILPVHPSSTGSGD